jgi:cytochrome b subunit of formate dehydrogenase
VLIRAASEASGLILGSVTTRVLRFTRSERSVHWLTALASAPTHLLTGTAEPATGRFNGGQKRNFLFVCVLLAALCVSGIDTIVGGTPTLTRSGEIRPA